jgi:hypothetical protein
MGEGGVMARKNKLIAKWDEPQVGEIWVVHVPYVNYLNPAHSWHYLLLERLADSVPTFKMLLLGTGRITSMHMNFELDDWRKHGE